MDTTGRRVDDMPEAGFEENTDVVYKGDGERTTRH